MKINVHRLKKRYSEQFALDVPALSIAAGQSFGLVGNNGAGKTTFLRLVLDLLPADEGHVEIDGMTVAESEDWKRNVGSYLDSSFLLDYLSPLEFFSFIGTVYGLTKAETMERLEPFAPFLPADALEPHGVLIRDLSTGNAKKVGIVAALFFHPEIVILDEPFANLDPRSQIVLKNMLRDLNMQQGLTMIISSHDLAHVTEVCKRIAVLEDGEFVREIDTSEETLKELQAYFAAE
ncbi:MAG: ABC transporter ATP-binding protein [Rhodothermales bacterium]